MIVQCAIIDDQTNDIEIIKNAVKSIWFDMDSRVCISTYSNPEDPDIMKGFNLYIIDIDMPGLNGFELAKKIYEPYPNAVIVFCTMHDNLVFDSFQLNAFYFVRKSHLHEDMIYCLKKFNTVFQEPGFYVAKTSDGLEKLNLSDIVYCEVNHNDLYIHLSDSSEKRERKPIWKTALELNPYGFELVGKSYLINFSHVLKMNETSFITTNNQEIRIPKSQMKALRLKYLQYISR